MLYVQDFANNVEALTDFKELNRNRKVNGEKTISLTLTPTENNQHSFPMVAEETMISFDNEDYVIKKLNERGIGNKYFKRVEAIHKFFVDMINKQQPNVQNGSMTFEAYMQFVFEGTGYTFIIMDSFNAQTFENLGKDNRLSLLKKGLERYQAEMEIVGKTQVRLKKKVGNDTDFQFRFGHNIKAIEKNVDTTNLATVIQGKGAEGITTTYRSPNADILGEIDAPLVEDERFTTEESLLKEMKKRLQDTPEFSITIDFVDLRAAGYPYTVPNEGDRVFVIYEPMNDLLLETRIMEINEVYDVDLNVYNTKVTLANYKKTFAGTMFGDVEKKLKDIITDDGIIKYSVLDEAVRIATEALQSAQTEVEFNNGFILRSKENPNFLVLINSAGIGVSLDGGATFRTAMTAEGIVADLITAGTMMFDRLRGGIMKLGEGEFGNGEAHVLDANGNVVGRIDINGVYSPRVQSNNFVGNVVNKYESSYANVEVYFDCDNGNDSNDGTSGSPKKDPQVFLNNLPKDLNGSTIGLRCKGSRGGTLIVRGFRNGYLNILDWDNNNGFNVNGLWAEDNTCDVNFQYITVWGTGGNGNAMAHSFNCPNVMYYSVKLYGSNGQSHGFWFINSTIRMGECHVYNITDRGMYASESSFVYFWNCKGTAPVCVLANDGSWVSGTGSRWDGSLVRWSNALLGSVGINNVDWEINLWSIDYGEATPPPPPPNPEQTLSISPSTGDNYSTQGFWTNDEVKQGNWGYGDRYGLWYVDLSAVKGKQILSAVITVSRGSGGTNAARTIHFRTHQYTHRGARPGGAPAMSGVGATGALAVGQTGTFDITSMVQNHIANGVDNAIGVHTTGQTDYMSLGTRPTITIRYK